jgi:hypothetical protein
MHNDNWFFEITGKHHLFDFNFDLKKIIVLFFRGQYVFVEK